MGWRALDHPAPMSTLRRESPKDEAKVRLQIVGFAALFDQPDRALDMIKPGAFDRVIEQSIGARPPLLWEHDPGMVVGAVRNLEITSRGLLVDAVVDQPRACELIACRRAMGLSFGYRAMRVGQWMATTAFRGRTLLDVDLVEISVVEQPLQDMAQIMIVKRLAERAEG